MGSSSSSDLTVSSNFTLAVDILESFDYFFQGLQPQYFLDNYADSLLLGNTIFSAVFSCICMFLNLSLILIVIGSPEMRNMTFFPVGFQAAVDFIGPGLANLVYEVQAYLNFNEKHLTNAKDYAPMFDDGKYYLTKFFLNSEVFGLSGCILLFGRILLNEYSTGICILATALIRYLLVCHPTSSFLNAKKLKVMAILIVGLTTLALAANIFEMVYRETEDTFQASVPKHAIQGPNYNNCVLTLDRKALRVSIEGFFLFLLPVTISSVLYARVIRVILKRKQDVDRNKSLTKAFVISWISWIICWSPNYVLMLTNPSDRYFREPTVGFHIYKYSLSFRDTVQSVYSQLNPFILIIVLRPFRETLKDLLL